MSGWSSNLAANRLFDVVGGEQPTEAALRSLGATSSSYTGEYRAGTAVTRRLAEPPLVSQRVTTARDLGAMLETFVRLAGDDRAVMRRDRTVGRRRPPGDRPAPSLPEGRRQRRSLRAFGAGVCSDCTEERLDLRCASHGGGHLHPEGAHRVCGRHIPRRAHPAGCAAVRETGRAGLSGIRRNDFGRQPVRAARACHRAGVAVALLSDVPGELFAGALARVRGLDPDGRRAERSRSPAEERCASGSPRARGCRAGAREGSRSTRSPSHRRLSGCPRDH